MNSDDELFFPLSLYFTCFQLLSQPPLLISIDMYHNRHLRCSQRGEAPKWWLAAIARVSICPPTRHRSHPGLFKRAYQKVLYHEYLHA